jgi:uncharacterized protein YpuA (DUF1002 family)
MTEREWHTATEKDFAEAEKECEREFCREHGRSPVEQATENQNEFAQEESSKVRVGSKVAHARRRAYAVLKAFEKKWKEGTETDEDCEIAFNEVCEVLRVNEDREDQLYQYVMRLLQDVDWPPHLSLHKMF